MQAAAPNIKLQADHAAFGDIALLPLAFGPHVG
jgi:hypothetical protein